MRQIGVRLLSPGKTPGTKLSFRPTFFFNVHDESSRLRIDTVRWPFRGENEPRTTVSDISVIHVNDKDMTCLGPPPVGSLKNLAQR